MLVEKFMSFTFASTFSSVGEIRRFPWMPGTRGIFLILPISHYCKLVQFQQNR